MDYTNRMFQHHIQHLPLHHIHSTPPEMVHSRLTHRIMHINQVLTHRHIMTDHFSTEHLPLPEYHTSTTSYHIQLNYYQRTCGNKCCNFLLPLFTTNLTKMLLGA